MRELSETLLLKVGGSRNFDRLDMHRLHAEN